jgi:hypothetical protein
MVVVRNTSEWCNEDVVIRYETESTYRVSTSAVVLAIFEFSFVPGTIGPGILKTQKPTRALDAKHELFLATESAA